MSPLHPIFRSPVWTSGILTRLEHKVLGGTIHNEISLLTATGVPPHIMLANELLKVNNRLDSIEENVSNKLNVIEDNILAKISELPLLVKENIMRNFEINGAVSVTEERESNS